LKRLTGKDHKLRMGIKMDEQIRKNIIYDRFLQVEGLAYMGKNLVEKGRKEKAIECFNRIVKEVKELGILLKRDTENDLEIAEKKNNG